MYIGFIPVLFAFAATLASFRNLALARVLWCACAVLVVVWTTWHGANHMPHLKQLGAW
ncbi:hypothetical protein N5K35_13540 [Pseudomonas sp. GD03651]|uniref:hypothetical protein n=1 Tax=Pseudomonas TaxID=286 RepID=UPI000A6A447B|nr:MULTISPECIES: hypothetical protein [Pseudomonas]MBI6922572.1 hypothetical protein [Pseudomonas monteilii]MDH2184730.1 hypothetical protein [Pseudomonas sp. GD03651]